ncbi:YcbK family protein [Castellaniella sp. UC4442_H9]
MKNLPLITSPGRRRFLLNASGLVAAATMFPHVLFAQGFWEQPRYLHIKRAQTGETVRETYWADGRIVRPGYERICHVLRDVQAGVAGQMTLRVLDILAGTQGWFRAYGQDRLIIATSGKRTPATNRATEGAAKDSQHMHDNAVDFLIDGVPTSYLSKLGLYLRGGGIGWYPNRHFVHVDGGWIRFWKG